jgi:recombination protein RecT
VSLVSSKTNYRDVDPNSVIASAMIAATLDLPINPNLGFAYIIPYSKVAQFQMGYKGYIQLALRSGQYKSINATEIHEGELISRNRITGEIIIDEDQKKSDKIIGYVSYFRLMNGFEKTLYMTVDEVTSHGKKYSKSYTSKDGR